MLLLSFLFLILAYFFYEIVNYPLSMLCLGIGVLLFLNWFLEKVLNWNIWKDILNDLKKVGDAKPKYPKGELENSLKKSSEKLGDLLFDDVDFKVGLNGKHTKKNIEKYQKIFK